MRSTLLLSLTALCMAASSAHAQDCPSAHTPEQVDTRLQTAQAALKDLNSEAFSLAMEEVAIMVPCLNSKPAQDLVAQLHRMRGIELYTSGKESAARQALRAARVLSPAYTFPKGFFPEGHALPDFWSEVPADAPANVRAPVPRDAEVAFDGKTTRDRPSDRATVFQYLGTDGTVRTTRYLMPKDPLPTYPSIPRQRNRLIIASIATGIVAGTSYALGWQGHQDFMEDDPKRTKAELSRMQTQVNTSFIISGVTTTLTVAGVTAAVLIGPR